MAAPAHRQHSKVAILSVGSTNITGTGITGAALNDVHIARVMTDDSGTSPGTTVPNTPGDWTPFLTQVDAGNFQQTWWWNRRGASNPDFRFNFTALGGFGYAEIQITGASGCITTGSPIAAAVSSTPGNSSQPNPPNATYSSADVLVYADVFSWAGWSAGAGPAVPTNYSATNIDNGDLYDTAIAWRQLTASTSEDPGTFGAADGTDSAVAATIVLMAAGAAGATSDPGMSGPRGMSRGRFPHLRMNPRFERKGYVWAPASGWA